MLQAGVFGNGKPGLPHMYCAASLIAALLGGKGFNSSACALKVRGAFGSSRPLTEKHDIKGAWQLVTGIGCISGLQTFKSIDSTS